MFGVFAAIFAVLVLIFALGRRSVKMHYYETRSADLRKMITELSIPWHVAREIQQKLLDGDQKWKTLTSINDDLTYIHGAKWRDRFREYDNLYDPYFYYGGALRILYAKAGYIDSCDVNGYNLNARTFFGPQFHEEHLNAMLKTCQVIERELKISRPDLSGLDLWFVPGGKYDPVNKKYVFYDDLSSGKLMFEFNKPRKTKYYNPDIRRLW